MKKDNVMINSYRDLVVWQKSLKLAKKVYDFTKLFPSEELFGITTQMRKSSVSVPSNIAEGYGRQYAKEYIRFLQIVRGSLYEFQTQLEISLHAGYLFKNDYNQIQLELSEIERMLNGLINKLKNK